MTAKELTLADTYKSSKAVPFTRLNADKTVNAFVDTGKLNWTESPSSGVSRRMIERLGGEVARCTTIVKFDPNKSFPTHTHNGGEEFMVLDGVWRDEYGVFPKYSYIRNYIGSKHTPKIGEEGCLIMVKLRQMSLDIKEPDHKYMNASPHNKQGWIVMDDDEEDKNRRMKVLYESKYEKVSVEEWKPDVEVEIEIPKNGKEIFVIEGSYATWENDVHSKHSWARYVDDGDVINVISGKNGCFVYIKEGHLNSPEVGIPLQSKI